MFPPSLFREDLIAHYLAEEATFYCPTHATRMRASCCTQRQETFPFSCRDCAQADVSILARGLPLETDRMLTGADRLDILR